MMLCVVCICVVCSLFLFVVVLISGCVISFFVACHAMFNELYVQLCLGLPTIGVAPTFGIVVLLRNVACLVGCSLFL